MYRSLRSIYRLFNIARVFARHGALTPFESALSNAGLAPVLLFFARILFGREVDGKRPGERLAAALSELGPAFIKLGQVLSTRSDLLGEQVAADLAKLQDQLPAFSSFAAKSRIEAELGAPLSSLFSSFDDEPVSAASISQVHFAITTPEYDAIDGRPVAVKVLRPGIEEAFQADIELLLWIAEIIERTQPKLRRLKPVEVVRTFAATVRIEMDLRLVAGVGDITAERASAVELNNLTPHDRPGELGGSITPGVGGVFDFDEFAAADVMRRTRAFDTRIDRSDDGCTCGAGKLDEFFQ
mgnify:CR=1 FL=1